MNRSNLRVGSAFAARSWRLSGVVALVVVVSLVSAGVSVASPPHTAGMSRANVQAASGPSNYEQTFEGTAKIDIDVDGDIGFCHTTGSGTFTMDLAGDLSVYEGRSRFNIDSFRSPTDGVPRGQYSSREVCDLGDGPYRTTDVQTTVPDCRSGCYSSVDLLDSHSYETVNDDGSVPYDWGVNFDLSYLTTETITDREGTITRPGGELFDNIFPLPVVKGVLAAVGSAVITAIVANPIVVGGVAAIALITIVLYAVFKKCKDPAVVQVNLTVSRPRARLLDKEKLSARLTAKPCKVHSYTFEWRRVNEPGRWVVLKTVNTTSTRASYSFKPKVAGGMYVRVRVTSSYQPTPGVSVIESTRRMRVRFPLVEKIVKDRTVKLTAKALWERTIARTTEHQYLEYCTLIQLNTRTGQYRHTEFVEGDPVFEGFVAECPTPKPYDNPTRPDLKDSPTYTVARMHTHPVQHYLTKGRIRPVGPSKVDRENARKLRVPSIVFDYVGENERVHGGWPIRAKTRIYTTNPPARIPPIFHK
jgi:hypothetical protein